MRSPLFALVKKDLKGYFDQPTGYILIVVFVALISYWFFRSAFLSAEASLRPLFTVDFTVERPSLPWLLALFVPAATMRLLAKERRDGTFEILLTHPRRSHLTVCPAVYVPRQLSNDLLLGFTEISSRNHRGCIVTLESSLHALRDIL